MKLLIIASVLLQLPAIPTFKISGHVTTFPGVTLPQELTLRTYGQGTGPMNLKSVPVRADGTFEISGAASGEYSLSLGDPFRSPSRNFTFRGTDVTDFEIKVPTIAAGRIVLADGRGTGGDFVLSATTPVTATNINRGASKTMASKTSPDAGGNFSLAVFPGDNIIGFDRVPDSYTVASVTYDGTDLQHSALRLNAIPASTIVVTVNRTK
jgi:hypothetical protein